MANFDIEDIGFDGQGYGGSSFDLEDVPFNFDLGGGDYSSFLNTLPELTTPGGSIFDFNFSDLVPDFGNIFGSNPELLNEFNYNVEVMDDGSRLITDELGKVVGGYDEEGREFGVNESGAGFYNDTGDLTAGESNINFGGELADKADVDALFKYNNAISAGGYPVMNKDGSVSVKDKDGNDLFKINDDGKITDVTPPTTPPTKPTAPKTPVAPGKISNNAALLAALLGGLLGIASTPKTGGAKGYMAGAGAGGSRPLTASRTALSSTGAPGAGGKRFLSDVTYAAEGGLMDIVRGQPNQNVTFMASGGVADVNEYIKMGLGMNAGDLRKADYLVRSGISPDNAKTSYGQVPEGMARGGISNLGSYSDGGRMLKGPGDGMSDDIPATIGGKRPARLADGEFVVSADVVSGLGNGSTDAGAEVLYGMMDRVRKARTGTKKQGKQINPKKYVPA